VALIGAANFGVSFGLALWTALRARDLDARATFRLMLELLRAFIWSPGRFLWGFPRVETRPDPGTPG
jgi:site-specific recombinase